MSAKVNNENSSYLLKASYEPKKFMEIRKNPGKIFEKRLEEKLLASTD